MKRPRLFLTLIVLAVFLAGCTAEANPTNPPAQATVPPTVTLPTATAAAVSEAAATEPAPSEVTALPVATSRGPDLHATDPTTVSLASGGLQFVEFFRFT
jgi:hypothetical protein